MGDFLNDFHVITMVSNSQRYKSRYRLYNDFARMFKLHGVPLWTAEIAFGERPFELTDPNEFRHLQLRSVNELWLKERALNLLINRLTEQYPNWKYVAWIDADVAPLDGDLPRWLNETWHQLQHYEVVQMFQNAIDKGPNGEAIHIHTGFAYSYRSNRDFKPGYSNWHPGFSWAATRNCIEAIGGGLLDFGILGSGDRHMAGGFIGKIEETVNMQIQAPYLRELIDWQAQAEKYVRRDIGFVPGTIVHDWHGRKRDRRYQDRWRILTECEFNPDRDIRPDAYGLWQLVDHGDHRSIELRDRVRDYFKSRNEDSIDLE